MIFSSKRGTQVRARRYLLALLVSTAIAGGSLACRAEDGLVDVRTLPHIEGATARPDDAKYPNLNASYFGAGSVADTIANTGKLLAADGWIAYTPPFEASNRSRWYKKGAQGVSASFMTDGSRTDRSGVSYSAQRLEVNLPFPDRATDIVYDERRPYLGCTTAETVDATLAFFQKELAALGWSPLSASGAEARWPDAKIDETIANGIRVYFTRDGSSRQLPVMLTLQRSTDNKTGVEIRVAPFALPQDLAAGPESIGLPRPERIKSAGTTGSADSIKREAHALIPAELGPVLAFYRRELGKNGWIEQSKDTVVTVNSASLAFTSPEETATMRIGRKYDLTTVQIDVQVLPSVIAARAKAKKEADDRFVKDALSFGQAVITEDNARRAAAQTARGPEAALRAMDGSSTPIPVPETASEIDFDGADGRLAFTSSSSVSALADFYRSGMKTLGWKSTPSVINNPNMVVLNFSKAKQSMSLTAMQMGPKVNVTATGSGLKGAPVAAVASNTNTTDSAKSVEQVLESDGDTDYPTPKQRTLRSLGTSGLPGGAPFRHELSASVPAGLDSVLAFYRRELTQRQWQEDTKSTVIKPGNAMLAFKAPDGPAMLKLERRNDETTVSLVVRHPAEATKAGILPALGKVRLLFGNMGDAEVSVSVNNKTIRVAPGVGGPQNPNGPTMELPPGAYKVTIKTAGKPAHDSTIKVAANDSWGLMVGPDGRDILPLQLY
ncbi:hypothetical protein [Tardiphaga sp. P9-11]|uniref:hypothetical protein n=1 Tax=Tardiphaga sp. P9-11 TaxID=2024614 RepID=UPI0011F3452B|nr:hypothetical protein [Tardiphaga sp. P9-11]KAA0078022.1 hypothetical protein CIW50_03000 [Tardiphaga sp. P9-11]